MAKQWKDMDKPDRRIVLVIAGILIAFLIYTFFPWHRELTW